MTSLRRAEFKERTESTDRSGPKVPALLGVTPLISVATLAVRLRHFDGSEIQ